MRLDGRVGKVNTKTKGTLLYHSSSYVTPPCTPSSLFPLPCLLRCFFFFSPSSSRLLLLSFPSSVSRCRDFRLSLSFSFFSLSSPSSSLSLCFRLCLLLDFSPLWRKKTNTKLRLYLINRFQVAVLLFSNRSERYTRRSRVCHWSSSHILTSSVIYHCTDPRQHGTSLFYIIVRKGTARSSDILKTLTTTFSFHNMRADRPESHAPNVKFILRFFYLHIYIYIYKSFQSPSYIFPRSLFRATAYGKS